MSSLYQARSSLLWKSDCYLSALEESLHHKKLLSLDIFDTILFRTVSDPTDVFVKTAEAAERAGLWKSAGTPDEFRLIRMQAEREARGKKLGVAGYDEVTLEQIYEELPVSLGDQEQLLQLELEQERSACFLNPNMASLIDWARARDMQIVLLSDMYLSSRQLRALLHASGLDETCYDLLLVSSEEKCSKASGGLFERLLSRYPNVPVEAIVHIGDQLRSDIHGAAIHAIQALHYQVIPSTFERPYHWDVIRHGNVLRSIQSLTKLTECTIDPDIVSRSESEQFFYQFGVRSLGPMLTSYCEWVIDVCIAEQRDEVHPLMREGVLLAPLLEQIARQRGLALSVKPLYVSRQATYLASLERFGARELGQLLGTDCKIGELFRVLDIQEECTALHDWLDLTVSECRTIIDNAGESVIGLVERYFLSERTLDLIQRSLERHRRLLNEYLQQQCANPEQLVTVDIGFHGTIQKNIEYAWKSGGHTSRMIHLLAVGGAGLEKLHLRGMDVRCHLGGVDRNGDLGQAIVRSPAFLEELLMGDFGTTIGYERDVDGKVVPMLAPLEQDVAELRNKLACHRGVLAFQASCQALRQVKPNVTDILNPREWYKPIHRVITMPSPEEARYLGNLKHQDSYLGEVSEICQPIPAVWFAEGEEAFLRACNFGPSTLNAYWPQGTLTRHSPYYLYNYYLRSSDSFGIQPILFDLIQQIQRQGITTIHVLGSGRVAERMMERAYLHQIYVEHYIQSREQLEYLEQESITGVGKDRVSCYVIASLVEEEIEAWREAIGALYINKDEAAPIVIFAEV